jgi:hypothetical protein
MKRTHCRAKDCGQDHLTWQHHTPRYLLISLLDWLDASIVGHRSYRLCQAIGNNSWWHDHWYNDETAAPTTTP